MKYFFWILLGIFAVAFLARADSPHILISQVQIAGETSTDEFAELYNPGDAAVGIADWKLTKKTSSGSQSNLVSGFPAGTIIGPHKYFLISHKTGYKGSTSADATYSGSSYSVAADNTIILSDASGAIVDKVGFGEAKDFTGAPAVNPDAGQSLKRKGWESGAMENTNNNQADFLVSASSPRNSSYGGAYVLPVQLQSSSSTEPGLVAPALENHEKGQLLINEVYPVTDAGEKEWVEIYNPGAPVNLDGWTMEDARDLIASFYGTILKYSVWEITPSRLNNDGDTIKLKSPNGQIIDIFSYGKMASSTPSPKPGESLARKVDGFYTGNASDFVLTETPTAGEKNIITAAAEEEIIAPPDAEPMATGTPVVAVKKSSSKKTATGNVSVRGTVIVPPGLFATQYFYIQKDDPAGGGVQIYSFKSADIPKLAAGDYIYVYGTASSYLGEERIKTKAGGIKLLEKRDPPEPIEAGIDELDEGMSGSLVKISGEITDKKSAGMYLDDGAGEIYVGIKKKAALNTGDILPKDKVEITGILISNDKGLSILPRFAEDIKKLESAEASASGGNPLLINILKYTLPSLAAVGLGVAFYFWRTKKKMVFEGAEIVDESSDKSSSHSMGED